MDKMDNVIDCLLSGTYTANSKITEYLKRVGSGGVDQLLKEPNRLNEEKAGLEKQTQEMAFSNYNTFIQTAECSREIFKEFTKTEVKVDKLSHSLPSLKSEWQSFADVTGSVNEKKNSNSHVMRQMNPLMDVLQLPQLMDSCIRRGQFVEAFELFSYVRRLGSKHGSIPLIANVVSTLEGSWLGMVDQLLAQLRIRTDLELPACLETMGFLRRMAVYSDSQLRLKYLQARDNCLRHQLQLPTSAQPGENVNVAKLEALRVHLFNVVAQYRAMFSDEDVNLPASEAPSQSALFHSWLTDQIGLIVSVIEEGAMGKQGDTLDSLLGQTMYFGLSFGGIGGDFRGPAALRIHRAATCAADLGFKLASRRFEQDMDNYVLVPGTVAFRPPASASASAADGPPLSAMEFPPLAEFTNNIVKVINELRSCAPLSTANHVASSLNEALKTASKIISRFYRRELTALGPGERATLARLCLAFSALVSFLAKVLSALYPLPELATHLGLPVHQLQTLDLVSLKDDAILEPLVHLMPRQEVVKVS